MSDLGTLMEASLQQGPGTSQLKELGIKVGKLYTNQGFPVDMALERLDLAHKQKLVVLDGICQWLITHKRNSGATEKAIDRQRSTNRKMIADFIKKGETGAY